MVDRLVFEKPISVKWWFALLLIAMVVSTNVFSYSLGTLTKSQSFYGTLDNSKLCNSGHGWYYAGICYTGRVSAVARHKNGQVFWSWSGYNIITTQGKNMVKSDLAALGTQTNMSSPIIIGLANATFTAAAADNFCCGGTNRTFVGGSVGATDGLDPSSVVANVVTSTGGGTWTVVKTVTLAVAATATVYGAYLATSCCQALTNTYSGPGAVRNTRPNPTGYLFAEAIFGTAPILATSDTLATTWSLTAS